MRTLDRQPSIYPENLLTTFATLGMGSERRWWGIYTKPRQEKPLARDLFRAEVPFFLPLIQRTIYRGRRIQSSVPMFPGYLFLFGSDQERLRAICTDRVSQLLVVHDAKTLVQDLSWIHRLIQASALLSPERTLRAGRQVRITSGPLAGLEGTLEVGKGRKRLVVGVHLLQRGVSLELGETLVEAIA
jgi:transcriptional antiterminator RfaH